MNKNGLILIKKPIINEIEIDDEYNLKEMSDKITNYTLIKALYAGSGKSTLALYFAKRFNKVIVCSPTNILAQKIKADNQQVEVRTIDSLLYRPFKGAELNVNINADLIIFDEIFMYSVDHILNIHKIAKLNPDLIMICTGDCNQLKPINFPYNNITDYKKYMFTAIQKTFTNCITLKENKRLKTVEDKQKLYDFTRDIFDQSITAETTLKKYFENHIVHDYKKLTKSNISYFKFRKHNIINKVMKLIDKKAVFEKGDEVICAKQYCNKKLKIARIPVNYCYFIEEVMKLEKVIKIRNTFDDSMLDIPMADFDKHFSLKYCLTCHSLQGSSLDEMTTIYDLNTPYVNREWIYTAITRVREFDKMMIFWHTNADVLNLEHSKVRQCLDNKIRGYKESDKKFENCLTLKLEDVINLKKKNDHCCLCRDNFYFLLVNGNVDTNFSVDRIDNTMGHEVGNVRATCVDCNVQMQDRELF